MVTKAELAELAVEVPFSVAHLEGMAQWLATWTGRDPTIAEVRLVAETRAMLGM